MTESTDLYAVMFDIKKEMVEIKEVWKDLAIALKAIAINTQLQQEALIPHEEYTTLKEEIVLPKLPKSTKKLDAEQLGKVYNFMGKNGPYICDKCKGLISWDLRPERTWPLHVDKEGHILGNGDCPEWGG